jgi:hypothetical protein
MAHTKNHRMRLITAHRILIGTAVAFFVFFAISELRSYATTAASADLIGAIFGIIATVALGIYMRTLWR